jgi:hypothetical protein
MLVSFFLGIFLWHSGAWFLAWFCSVSLRSFLLLRDRVFLLLSTSTQQLCGSDHGRLSIEVLLSLGWVETCCPLCSSMLKLLLSFSPTDYQILQVYTGFLYLCPLNACRLSYTLKDRRDFSY